MRSLTYLNAMLTVVAILLALNLWASHAPTALESTAYAQAKGAPILDAGAQRQEMIDLLKRVAQQTEDINKALKSGELRVRVEAIQGNGEPARK